jgi:hypothetical protein
MERHVSGKDKVMFSIAITKYEHFGEENKENKALGT